MINLYNMQLKLRYGYKHKHESRKRERYLYESSIVDVPVYQAIMAKPKNILNGNGYYKLCHK